MTVKLLTEHNLEFLGLHVTGDCTGLSESTPVKTPHFWKSHVAAQLEIDKENVTTLRSKSWPHYTFL